MVVLINWVKVLHGAWEVGPVANGTSREGQPPPLLVTRHHPLLGEHFGVVVGEGLVHLQSHPKIQRRDDGCQTTGLVLAVRRHSGDRRGTETDTETKRGGVGVLRL